MAASPNSERWEINGAPEPVLPWERAETTASWVWTLKHKETGQLRELLVSVGWRGYDNIEDVPSAATRAAFRSHGREGVDWFLGLHFDSFNNIIFHAQTLKTPFGSTGSHAIQRLPRRGSS